MKSIRKKEILLLGVFSVLIFTILFFVNFQEESKPVKIAISLWSGDAHAFIAEERGFFEENGVSVELIYSQDYADSQELYRTGQVDGLFGTLSDAVYYSSTDVDSKIVYITDYSEDADVIVGNMQSFDEIKGKTISIENVNSYSHIFVLAALDEIGLSENDVYFRIVPAHDVVSALEAGLIDAGHTWEPITTQSKELGYNVLFTAGQVPGIITSTFMVNADLVESHPDTVRKIVQSLVEAQDYRDNHWKESMEVMARHMNISPDDVEAGFAGIVTLDLESNIEMFDSILKEQMDFVSTYYLDVGQITTVPEYETIIDDRFVKDIGNRHEDIN